MSRLLAVGFALFVVVIAASSGALVALVHPESAAGDTYAEAIVPKATPVPDSLVAKSQPWAPRTKAPITLRTGPDEDYPFLASMPAGHAVEVLGRDETARWLAVQLGPGGALTGWVEAGMIDGISDVSSLALAQTTPVEAPPIGAAVQPVQPQQEVNRGRRTNPFERNQDNAQGETDSRLRQAQRRALEEACERLEERRTLTREEYLFYRQYCD
jgi:uncharacterized protein YraI